VISLILSTSIEKAFNALIDELVNYISKTVEAIRKGRSFRHWARNIHENQNKLS
jgi:hypothetical protein